MLIEKWYLDFQNDDVLGYYYVGHIKVAGVSIAFSEIHHHATGQTINHQQMNAGQSRQLRSISSKQYSLQLSAGQVELQINHKDGVLAGRWKSKQPSLSEPYHPLYENEAGSCRWKVWSPRASVELMATGASAFDVTGSGYIDFVQISIPTWKIPFQSLYWGRLFSDKKWICLFKLTAPGFERGLCNDGDGWTNKVSVEVNNAEERVSSFRWQIDSQQIQFNVKKTLHSGPILDPDRTAWLPGALRNWLSSVGFEKKYNVSGSYNGEHYNGIMEEVRWNNNEPGTQIIW